MDCAALRDDQWERIKGFVPGGTKGKRGPRTDNRKLNALLWMARSGGRWRGPAGAAWRLPFGEAALLSLDRDGCVGRHAGNVGPRSRPGVADASPPACRRCPQGERGADAQGLGRSRGGQSTKIQGATEALGLPVRLIGSPGQRNGIALAHDLIDDLDGGSAIADKGYDADHLVAQAVPPCRNPIRQATRQLYGFVKLTAIAIWLR